MLNRYKFLLLAILLLVIHFQSGVTDTITLRPQSVHQWRQCDSASQALNYYQNDISFWTPQTFTQIGKNGHAASEFPIIYYFVAQLYKLFGFHEYLFRSVNLLLFTAGLIAIFIIAHSFTSNVLLSFAPVILVGTSPYMYYYANNFLPNVPAISLVIIGWGLLLFYLKSGKKIQVISAFFFFTLGSLIKTSEVINVIAACMILAAGYFHLFSLNSVSETWRKHVLLKLVLCCICFACLIAWNQYAIWFNKNSESTQNLLGILPIWNMAKQDILNIKNRFSDEWSYVIFDRSVWHLLGLATVMFVVLYNRFHPLLRLITLLLFLGVISYSLLWFEAFYHHDYYMLTFIVFPIFLCISWIELLIRTAKIQLGGFSRFTSALILILFINYLINYNHRIQNKRYPKGGFSDYSSLMTIEPYLRSLGVKRTDLVVSVPDRSANISLYLMNNPGWTELFTDAHYNINYFYTLGAKYLIISDSSYINSPLYAPYTHEPIGSYQGVNIYALKKQASL